MDTHKYGWKYWRDYDRARMPVAPTTMFNVVGDALQRSVDNALAQSRAKVAQEVADYKKHLNDHDCHASPEDGCQACLEHGEAEAIDLQIDRWKEDRAEMEQAMQEYECSKHGCIGQ